MTDIRDIERVPLSEWHRSRQLYFLADGSLRDDGHVAWLTVDIYCPPRFYRDGVLHIRTMEYA